MSKCSIVVESRTTPGNPFSFVGEERICGSYIDKVAAESFENNFLITMDIGADPIESARLLAYTRFAIDMLKLTPRMLPDFDYKDLLIHTTRTGEPI